MLLLTIDCDKWWPLWHKSISNVTAICQSRGQQHRSIDNCVISVATSSVNLPKQVTPMSWWNGIQFLSDRKPLYDGWEWRPLRVKPRTRHGQHLDCVINKYGTEWRCLGILIAEVLMLFANCIIIYKTLPCCVWYEEENQLGGSRTWNLKLQAENAHMWFNRSPTRKTERRVFPVYSVFKKNTKQQHIVFSVLRYTPCSIT